jgi:TonB-linked SusC/RagA family outer membrane protein
MKNNLLKMILAICMGMLTLYAAGQAGGAKGKVTDNNGEPLIGATVVMQGTTVGTITDVDGNFTIYGLPTGEVVLEASYVGYKKVSQTLSIAEDQTVAIDFTLEEDIALLDELVVIGYGTKRKRDITSSISSVKSDELRNSTEPSFQSALQGKAAGVMISTSNGMPGSAMTVRIRGTSSIRASSQPLYVVDGIPVITGNFANGWADGTNALSAISPSDIESVEFLKDASAAAIYGSRSANGVVLITTKSGKSGKTRFNAGYWLGFNSVTNVPDMLTGPEYIEYGLIAWHNSFLYNDDPEYSDIEESTQAWFDNLPFGITREIAENTNTDWIDEMTRTGIVHNFNLSASGGDVKNTFYIGGAYRDEEGVQIGNDYKRLSAKANFDHKANEKFSVGTKITYVYELNERVPTGWAGGLGTAQSRSLPIMPVYDSIGKFFAPRSGTNPVAYNANLTYGMHVFTTIGTVYGQYNFTDWLSLRGEAGANIYSQREVRHLGTISQENGFGMDRRISLMNLNSKGFLNFNKTFADLHTVTAMVGISQESKSQHEVELNGSTFSNPGLKHPNNAGTKNGFGYETRSAFLSYFSRVSYNMADKYYITASISRDASSRFGKNYRHGWFPAASVGWTVSEEDFFSGIPVVSYLKLRSSWGVTGNGEFDDFAYMGLWGTGNYMDWPGLVISNVENPDLRWERSSQIDVGLDFQLWTGRISGGFDYYFKKTSDLILPRPINQTSGSSTIIMNVGDMENKGIELFLTSHNLPASSQLKWVTNLNLGRNANEVTNTENEQLAGENFGNNVVAEGYAIGTWELVEWAGIAREDETKTVTDWIDFNDQELGTTTREIEIKAGDELFYNHWGELTNEFNFDRDASFVGNPYPKFFGGLNNTFNFKGIDLSIFFTFNVGQDVYRDDGKFLDGGFDGNWNQTAKIMDAWSENNPGGSSHKLYWQPENRNYNSTRYLEDASYLRLKTLTLGYTLPKSLSTRFKVERLRVYMGGTNLWTLTNYTGWDPEVNRDGSGNITQGVTYLSPPQVKTISFGIELDF